MNKKQRISILLLICVVLSSMMLPSCNRQKNKFVTHSLDYFDTATTVTGYEADKETFDRVSGEILKKLGEYHRLYTIYHRYDGLENLCTVNELENGKHRVVTVDRRIVDMLLYAKEMHRITDGKTNVAMGSVLSVWHTYRAAGMDEPWAAELPPQEKLTEAAKHTNIEDLIIDEAASTVFLADPEMTLDVGAIAKGYAVEMVAQSMEEKGITGYILNVGGNVRAVGEKPDGEEWEVGVEDPFGETDHISYLSLSREALVTSGAYQRYYLVDGKRYHHIIHPETLMPVEGYMSVSVVTAHSGKGDALSTALFCMSLEEGLSLISSLPDAEAQWVLADGTVHTSDGWTSYTAEK